MSEVNAEVARDPIAAILAAFGRSYLASSPFKQDRELVDELRAEARPVIEALLFADKAGSADVNAIEHHEGLAMVTLLGRRAGALGATPSAVLALVPSLSAGFRDAGKPLSPAIHQALQAMCMEGYVAGREEHLQRDFAQRTAQAQPIVRVAPRCLAVFLAGHHDADDLAEVIDRLGRTMLDANALGCVVDLERLEEPAPDRAAEVFNADAAARMLGATCVFTGVSPAWMDAARRARVPTDLIALEPSFERGLHRALAACGLEVRPIGWLPEKIRKMLRR